jgi:hypothetical protein
LAGSGCARMTAVQKLYPGDQFFNFFDITIERVSPQMSASVYESWQ